MIPLRSALTCLDNYSFDKRPSNRIITRDEFKSSKWRYLMGSSQESPPTDFLPSTPVANANNELNSTTPDVKVELSLPLSEISLNNSNLNLTKDQQVRQQIPPSAASIPTLQYSAPLTMETTVKTFITTEGSSMMEGVNQEGPVEKEEITPPSLPSRSNYSLINRRLLRIMNGFTFNWVKIPQEFQDLVASCQQAITFHHIQPQRISQGSSGSYFVKDESGDIVGVFKPKDEEPYGQLNPRWIKWLHRTCCPCLFGRSFLMPNTGYVSEAAASVLDQWLGLNMVPHTEIVHLSSSSFYFPWWEHYRIWQARRTNPSTSYPLKLGSFQVYVEGFEESSLVLAKLESLRPLEPELKRVFQLEFEKMTILDYAMRNTDRTMDNWLIHLSWIEDDLSYSTGVLDQPNQTGAPNKTSPSNIRSALPSSHNLAAPLATKLAASEADLDLLQRANRLRPRVKIACIDNGLAFPFRHPSEVRSYPYSWINLPEARTSYSSELRAHLLPILTNFSNWEQLVLRLRRVFSIDADFNEHIFQRQMAILRGQLWNIAEALVGGESPLQLVHRPLLMIEAEDDALALSSMVEMDHSQMTSKNKRFRRRTIHANPLCSCW